MSKKTMPKGIKYIDIVKMGFTRVDLDDEVFFNEHGYECFFYRKKIAKGFRAYWHPERKSVEVTKEEGNGDILARMSFNSLDEAKCLIEFLGA